MSILVSKDACPFQERRVRAGQPQAWASKCPVATFLLSPTILHRVTQTLLKKKYLSYTEPGKEGGREREGRESQKEIETER